MGARGPARTCDCGDLVQCRICRRREIQRRCYYGEPPLNPLHFRAATIELPEDPMTLGYLAGLLDGEGYVGRQNGRWKVQIAMTTEPLIRWLGEMGAGVVKERPVQGNRQRCWVWLLMRQADVHAFLIAVLPLLRVKREAAVAAIAEIEADVPSELLAAERMPV